MDQLFIVSLLSRMKAREESTAVLKVHHDVENMLAVAKQIVKPGQFLPVLPRGNNTHLEIHLPPSRISVQLKQILRQPDEHYKRIDRSKGKSLSKLETSRENEETRHVKLLSTSRHDCPSLLMKITTNKDLTTALNNVESELLDHRHHFTKRTKKPLLDKKYINLFPEIPEIKHKNKIKRNEYISLLQKQNLQPRDLLTISYPDLIDIPSYKPEVGDGFIDESIFRSKEIVKERRQKYSSMTLDVKPKHQYLNRTRKVEVLQRKDKVERVQKINDVKNLKVRKEKRQSYEEEKYQPWSNGVEETEDLF